MPYLVLFAEFTSYDPRKDFKIRLSNISEHLGFSRQDILRDAVYKYLSKETDFMLGEDDVLLNVLGFKKLCVKASTNAAVTALGHYTTMEQVAYERKLADKDAELEHFRGKRYEDAPKTDKVYIMKEASQLGTDIHKIGKSVDETKREAQLNTGSADGTKCVYSLDVTNGKLVEDIIKHCLKRYHHAREHFNCKLEHTADCFDIAGTVVDTLASSYEIISREELFDRVVENLRRKIHG